MRTADTTVLAKTSKEVLAATDKVLEDHQVEALQFDFDSITVLITELTSAQLARDNLQWVLWHLLEHILVDVHQAADMLEGDDEDALDDLWENMDAYMNELEDGLKARSVRVVCPRLDALIHDYWMEAEESEEGSTPVTTGEKPEEAEGSEEEEEDPEEE